MATSDLFTEVTFTPICIGLTMYNRTSTTMALTATTTTHVLLAAATDTVIREIMATTVTMAITVTTVTTALTSSSRYFGAVYYVTQMF